MDMELLTIIGVPWGCAPPAWASFGLSGIAAVLLVGCGIKSLREQHRKRRQVENQYRLE